MMRRFVAAMCLAACGGSGGGPDGPGGGPDAETGLCAGKPCRTSIRTVDDWVAVSMPHASARCDFVEDGKYLAPATGAAALQEIVFQDVETHRYHLEFMTQVLPEYFGGLTATQYQALVQRRATRQYWAGAIFKLVDVQGTTLGWGFDVIVDPTSWEEDLTEAEVMQIEALLETRFQLPLVYAPTTPGAIYNARDFTQIAPHFPRACQHTTCPNPSLDCVVVPSAVPLCGHFMEGRTVQIEHRQKARLAAGAGTIELPRGLGDHTVPAIFTGGELGPARTPIVAQGTTATYEVRDIGGYITHDYIQRFTAGSRPVTLRWQINLPEGGGGFLLAEPHVSGHVYAHGEVGTGGTYDDMIAFSSCTAETLPHWRRSGVMAGGDGFVIDFRYEVPGAGSGPLFVTRGRATLGGQTVDTTDYFDLVYAGEHHNWNNQFWVLFDAPITYQGHAIHGLWLDEVAYMSELEAAWTLGANLGGLDPLTVTTYTVEQVQ